MPQRLITGKVNVCLNFSKNNCTNLTKSWITSPLDNVQKGKLKDIGTRYLCAGIAQIHNFPCWECGEARRLIVHKSSEKIKIIDKMCPIFRNPDNCGRQNATDPEKQRSQNCNSEKGVLMSLSLLP